MRGGDVVALQIALNGKPSGLPLLFVNGKFDRATRARVKEFQHANGLIITGTVDAETRKRIYAKPEQIPNKTPANNQPLINSPFLDLISAWLAFIHKAEETRRKERREDRLIDILLSYQS